MHLPDGFLSLPVSAGTSLVAAMGVGGAYLALRRSSSLPDASNLGLGASLIFVSQMVNFPVAGGTSGHLLGGAVASILFGPFAAVLIMTGVLIVQCLIFHDGGWLTFGANVVNMGLVGVGSGFCAYHLWGGAKRPLTATAVAAWISVMMSALCCAAELVCSGTVAASRGFPAMLETHAWIGLGEAIISVGMVFFLTRAPVRVPTPRPGLRVSGAYALLATFLLLTPIACDKPDGLNALAKHFEFDSKEIILFQFSPWEGYAWRGVKSGYVSTLASGFLGAALTGGALLGVGRRLKLKGFRREDLYGAIH